MAGSKDNGAIALLLVNGSGAAWMFDEHADDMAEGFGVPWIVIHFLDVFGPRPRHLGKIRAAEVK